MKTFLLVACLFFTLTSMHAGYQDDSIELKSGKVMETKITGHSQYTVITERGKYSFRKIKKIKFFTKNYDDVKLYETLRDKGIEVEFITTPH